MVNGPAEVSVFSRTAQRAGAVIALGIAVQAIYVAYYGTWEPSIHRSAALALCTAVAILIHPAAERYGRGNVALQSILWIIDLCMIGIVAYACWRFVSAVDDMENLITEFSMLDQIAALGALLVLIEMTRRIFGLPLAIVAGLALLYVLFGGGLPGIFRHTGFSLQEMVEVVWYGFQGVLGLPTGIVLSLIMIYIIFGSVLQATGAGDNLVRVAFALTGRTRSGPAHAAIVASGIFGTMSGSVAANVVGTGAVTIPLIKKRGFSPAFAGGVEAAASTGGQIMPPVMGAAVFLMSELVGVPYLQLCAAALLPALFYYASLFITVGLEAHRLGIVPIPPEERPRLDRRDLVHSLMFVVPIAAILITLFMGRSPAMAGFFAVATAILFGFINPEVRKCPWLIIEGLIEGGKAGSRIMIAVGSIGILLAILDLTGISIRFAEMINFISGQGLFIGLLICAGSCLILGMGMPTLPAYLIIVLILGPAVKQMGVPDVAIHLFVFYFGVLSAITPPVAIAAFAAAPISQANPMTTAVRAIGLALTGFVIPFVFVYNQSMLLILEFYWGALGWVVVRLGLAIWLLATAITGFETRRLGAAVRLLRLVAAIMLVVDILPAQIAALAVGLGLIGLSIMTAPAEQKTGTA